MKTDQTSRARQKPNMVVFLLVLCIFASVNSSDDLSFDPEILELEQDDPKLIESKTKKNRTNCVTLEN